MAEPGETRRFSEEEQQNQWVKESVQTVKNNSFHMKRALDKCDLQQALVFSGHMLGELRTSLLSPQHYYELYMVVFDELTHLESYFYDEIRRGTRPEELYEVVQHAGNIVPRLYLLITVGSVYIKSKDASAKDILKDLVEMCKGVQHPTRGLFLRTYLSQKAKNKLPDEGNEFEGEGGSVADSVDFVVQNFAEMVRLWVRMEGKGIIKDKEKREKERKELRVLVGFNLVRLSQLDGVDLQLYQEVVLPRILEIIIQSKDFIAQQYLMEVIVQVFPDEFHLATLQKYLDASLSLHQNVDLRNLLTALMDRLGNYAAQVNDGTKPKEGHTESCIEEMIPLFTQHIAKTVQDRPKVMTAAAFVQTQLSLLNVVLKAFPDNLAHVNQVFSSTRQYFIQHKEEKIEKDAVKPVKKLLTAPALHYGDATVCLKLDEFHDLLALLDYKARREVDLELTQSLIKSGKRIDTPELVQKLFQAIRPLVADEEGQPPFDEIYAYGEEDFVEEQNTVAALIHSITTPNLDVQFKLYSACRKQFGIGGERRLKYTLVPMLFCYFKLAIKIYKAVNEGEQINTRIEKVFNHAFEMLQVLRDHIPETVLRLYLQAATTADICCLNDLCYEGLSQALQLYDEQITDTKTQMDILTVLINTCQHLKNLAEDNYDTICGKICQYSAKCLKKQDQCQAIYLCSHLFWSHIKQDAVKVVECLQKSVKLVESCMTGVQTALFVNILNEYLYYFHYKNEKVAIKHLNILIDLVNERKKEPTDEDPHVAPIEVFYRNTLNHIHIQQEQDQGDNRWSGVNAGN